MDYVKLLSDLQNGSNIPISHYCETCGVIKETYYADVKEKFEINKETLEIEGKGLFCSKCKQRISDVETDDRLLMTAYNKYREKHEYLMPHQIKQIREMYNLSAKQFAQVLGMGEHTIYNYEKGALQNYQHNVLIKCAMNPTCMRGFILNNQTLSKKNRDKTLELIGKMCLAQQLYSNSNSVQIIPKLSLAIG